MARDSRSYGQPPTLRPLSAAVRCCWAVRFWLGSVDDAVDGGASDAVFLGEISQGYVAVGLFEALVLSFAVAMPMAKVAAMTREHDTRIWRIVEHHVHTARDQLDCTGVTRVGMDETSAAKGQDNISIFADLDARRVIFATDGRSARTVARFAADLAGHGGDPEKVTDTSSDMSTAFISPITQHLPNATMTFDRYHLAAKLSEAIDTVAAPRSPPARNSPTPAGCGSRTTRTSRPNNRANSTS